MLLARAILALGLLAGPAAAEDAAVAWARRAEAGVAAAQAGDLAAAERAFEDAHALAAGLAPDDPRRATAAHNLGFARYARGWPGEALSAFREALALREASFGRGHPVTAQSLSSLGEALRATGQHAAAEEAHRRALEIRRTTLAPGHPELAESLNAYGVLLIDLGRFDEAEASLREALTIRAEVLGERQLPVAETRSHLGALAFARGRHPEAELWYRQSLEVEETVFGSASPALIPGLTNLALVMRAQGRAGEAAGLLERALGLQADDAATLAERARLRALLGTFLAEADEPTRARAELERSIAATEQALGPNHPDLIGPLLALAGLERQARPEEALAMLHRAVAIGETTEPSGGPRFAAALHNLALLQIERGELDEADRLLDRIAGIEGQTAPELARTLTRHADLLTALGRGKQAAGMRQQARALEGPAPPTRTEPAR